MPSSHWRTLFANQVALTAVSLSTLHSPHWINLSSILADSLTRLGISIYLLALQAAWDGKRHGFKILDSHYSSFHCNLEVGFESGVGERARVSAERRAICGQLNSEGAKLARQRHPIALKQMSERIDSKRELIGASVTMESTCELIIASVSLSTTSVSFMKANVTPLLSLLTPDVSSLTPSLSILTSDGVDIS